MDPLCREASHRPAARALFGHVHFECLGIVEDDGLAVGSPAAHGRLHRRAAGDLNYSGAIRVRDPKLLLAGPVRPEADAVPGWRIDRRGILCGGSDEPTPRAVLQIESPDVAILMERCIGERFCLAR